MSEKAGAKFPSGPPPNLIRSLFGAMQQNPLDYFTAMARKYGDVSGMRIGNFRSFFINHPDLIEDVLVKNTRLYHKGRILQANKFLFGEGLLTSEGDFWLRQRRLSQPAFHRARIHAFATTMAGYADEAIALWREALKRNPCLFEACANLQVALRAKNDVSGAEAVKRAQGFCVFE